MITWEGACLVLIILSRVVDSHVSTGRAETRVDEDAEKYHFDNITPREV